MKTPWHIWVVGIVTLLWHGFGAYDYVMTLRRDPGYLAMLPADRRADFIAYLDAIPTWAVFTYTLGIWGAVAGSLLILIRSRHAVTAFGLSLVGLALTNLYTYGYAPPSLISTPDAMTLALTAVIAIVLLAALYYARRQTVAGTLR